MNLQNIPVYRLPLVRSVTEHALEHKRTDLDPGIKALDHLGVQLPAQRIEEDSLRVLRSLQVALEKQKITPATVRSLSKINRPVGQADIDAMVDSALFYRRELLLKVIQHVIVHDEHPDIAYNVLEDFDVELTDRFLLNSLNVVFQEADYSLE